MTHWLPDGRTDR